MFNNKKICGEIPFNTDISEFRPKRTCEPFVPATYAQHIRNIDHATQYASLIQYISSILVEPCSFSQGKVINVQPGFLG